MLSLHASSDGAVQQSLDADLGCSADCVGCRIQSAGPDVNCGNVTRKVGAIVAHDASPMYINPSCTYWTRGHGRLWPGFL